MKKIYLFKTLLLSMFFMLFAVGVNAQTIIEHVSGNELVGEACLYRVTSSSGTVTNAGWEVTPSTAATSVTEVAIDIVEISWAVAGTHTLDATIQVGANPTAIPATPLSCVVEVNKTQLNARIDYARFNYPTGTTHGTPPSNAAFYTSTTWSAYTAALNAAIAARDNVASSQSEVDAAVTTLNSAIAGLALSSNLVKRNVDLFKMSVTPPQNDVICAGSTVNFLVNINTEASLKAQDKGIWPRNTRRNELYMVLPDWYTNYFTAAAPAIGSNAVELSVIKENSGTVTPGVYRYANYNGTISMNLRNDLGTIAAPIVVPYKIVWRTKLIDGIKTGCIVADNDFDWCTDCIGEATCPDKGDWATVGYYEGVLVIPATVTPVTPTIASNLTGGAFLCTSDYATILSTANHPDGSYYTWKKDGAVVSAGVDFKALVVNPAEITAATNYTLEVLDYGQCPGNERTSNTVAISPAIPPTVSANNLSAYVGDVIDLNDAIVTPNTNYTYTFYTDEDCLHEVANPTTIQLNDTTEYWVKATDNTNSCETVEPFLVEITDWDLGLEVVAPPVCLNEEGTYTLVIINPLQRDAQDVLVTVEMTSGLSPFAENTTQGTYSLQDGEWLIPTLRAESRDTLEITFTANGVGNTFIISKIAAINGTAVLDPVTNYLTVLVNEAPTVSIATPEETEINCATTSITLRATTDASNASYSWSKGTDEVSTDDTLVVTTAGIYTVTITDENGCIATSTEIEITKDAAVPTAEIVNLSEETVLTCALIEIEVRAEGGVSYLWDDEDATANDELTITEPGTYTVTVTGANGCTDTKEIIITQNIETPIVSVSKAALCIGEDANLSPNTGGTWRSNNTTVATVDGGVITGVSAGTTTFTFTVTENGCTVTTEEITVMALPICSITGVEEVAAGAISTFNAPANMTSYNWSVTTDGEIQRSNEEQIVNVIGGATNCESSYALTLTVDSMGCVSTCVKEVAVIAAPISISLDTIESSVCGNFPNAVETVGELKELASNAGVTLLINVSDDLNISYSDGEISSNKFTRTYYIEDACGSEDSLIHIITQGQKATILTPLATPAPYQAGDDMEFEMDVDHHGADANNATYVWRLGGQIISTDKDLSYTLKASDNKKNLVFTVTNDCGRVHSRSVIITVTP